MSHEDDRHLPEDRKQVGSVTVGTTGRNEVMTTLAQQSQARLLYETAAAEVDGVLAHANPPRPWSQDDVRDLMIAMWLRGSEWRDRAAN